MAVLGAPTKNKPNEGDIVKPGQTIRVLDDALYREPIRLTRLTTHAGVTVEAVREATVAPLDTMIAVLILNADSCHCRCSLVVFAALVCFGAVIVARRIVVRTAFVVSVTAAFRALAVPTLWRIGHT